MSQLREAVLLGSADPIEVLVNWPEPHWTDNSALLLLVGAAVGLLFGFAGDYLRRTLERRHENAALLAAFHGEVSAIRGSLRRQSLTAEKALTKLTMLKRFAMPLPREIYEANASKLGSFRDTELARGLVHLYGHLRFLGEQGRRVEDGTYEPLTGFPSYVRDLAHGFRLAIKLDVLLASGGFEGEMTEEDRGDLSVASRVFDLAEKMLAIVAERDARDSQETASSGPTREE